MTAEHEEAAALTARVDELEIRLSFQDDTIERLSQIVARQDDDLRQLHRRFQEATDQMQALSAQLEPGTGNEPPPHY